MVKRWQYALFFVICLLLFLLANMPVNRLLEHLVLPAQLRLYQPEGTLFAGHLRQVSIDRFSLQDLRYRWLPGCLLQARWCYQVDMPAGSMMVGAGVPGSALLLSAVDVEYAVGELTPLLPALPVQPTGSLRLRAEAIKLENRRLMSMDATVTWSGLGVAEGKESLSLGDYQADISAEADQIDFELRDVNALLQVSGGGTVSSDGRYSLDIDLSSDGVLPERVKSILGLVARSTGYNRYQIVQEGSDRRLSW